MRNITARVLLIEDDERIRKELLDSLRASGFDVDVSVHVRHARLALERDYDVVLLDLGLPDGDGLDLCRELRARGRSVPVIIMDSPTPPITAIMAAAMVTSMKVNPRFRMVVLVFGDAAS